MRLFIAVRPGRQAKKALRAVQDEFRRRGVEGNYTSAENLHLTLAFIGDYPDPARVLDVLETVDFEPVALKLDHIGAFGNLWWAGCAESEALAALVRRVRRALAEAGIPFDRKRFSAHFTLIRRAVCPRRCDLSDVAAPAAAMTVERISLMISTRGKNGMIYTELGAVAAADSE